MCVRIQIYARLRLAGTSCTVAGSQHKHLAGGTKPAALARHACVHVSYEIMIPTVDEFCDFFLCFCSYSH